MSPGDTELSEADGFIHPEGSLSTLLQENCGIPATPSAEFRSIRYNDWHGDDALGIGIQDIVGRGGAGRTEK